ncbi:hypothetical protein QOZ28_00630 [Pseudomonas aeruginosa]|uniref:hypothetical protein n=1 Tax=Pseudomonas aeruginosa TaxID=287 RepID=UPI0011C454AE
MGRKVKRYGATILIGEYLWGAKVKVYGVKIEGLWGDGESLWEAQSLDYLFIYNSQQTEAPI